MIGMESGACSITPAQLRITGTSATPGSKSASRLAMFRMRGVLGLLGSVVRSTSIPFVGSSTKEQITLFGLAPVESVSR